MSNINPGVGSSSGGGGTQYPNGAVQATPVGTVALGYDGTAVRAIRTAVDGSQQMQLNAYQSNTSGSITTATDIVTATDLMGVGAVTVQISGTYAGVNVTFEVSVDGANWIAMAAQPIGSVGVTPMTSTGVLVTNSTNVFNISPLFGIAQLRVRATAWTSGIAAVIISPSAQFTSYYTAAAVSDGINTASIKAGDPASNGLVVAAGEKSYSFTSSGTGAQSIGPFDSSGYAWVTIQYTSVGTGAVGTGQFSLDSGTTWTNVSSFQSSGSTAQANAALAINTNMFSSRVWGRSFRINLTALTSGSVTGTVAFSNAPFAYSTNSATVTQAGTWAVNATNITSATSSGPLLAYFNNSLTTTTQVAAGSHRLHMVNVYNPNPANVFLQLFNVLAASVTLGTTTPTQSWLIPAGGVLEEYFTVSLDWSAAISIAATTTPTGSTTPASGLSVNFGYV